MNKPLSLLFAVAAILCLVAAGVSLGFGAGWLAFLFIVLFIVVTGCGFALKSRWTKENRNQL